MEKICCFCTNRLSKNAPLLSHLIKCKNNFLNDKNETLIYYLKITYPILINNLKDEYDNNNLNSITYKYNISRKYVIFLLNYYSIKIRNLDDSYKIGVIKNKNTCQKRYGVDNASQIEDVKEKKKQTFIKNYGVDNIWKSSEYNKWLTEYMLSTYGVKRKTDIEKTKIGLQKYWNNLSIDKYKKFCEQQRKNIQYFWDNISKEKLNEFKNKMKEIGLKTSPIMKNNWNKLSDEEKNYRLNKLHNNFISKKELTIKNILDDLFIEYKQQFITKGRYSFDFLIKNTNIIIEVQGDYWHANPIKYKDDDIIHYPNNKFIKAKNIWKKDLKKLKKANELGYNIIYIWENEINKIPYDILKIKILNEISNLLN